MFFPPNLGPEFMRVVKPLWDADEPDFVKLRGIWGLLTGLQGIVLSQLLLKRIGDRVFAGPFRGMQIVKEMMGRPFAPLLLGTYEWELHDAIEKAIAKPYKKILNIGCSYGAYAVGMARRMPEAEIHAFDTDVDSRDLCRKMAEVNDVADRVVISERFAGEDFARFAGSEALVIMDIEGGEADLLNPKAFPALLGMDVIVEIHDCVKPGLSTALPLRFAETHTVRVLPNRPFSFPLEKIMGSDYVPDHFDNLIATWEGRIGPTPFGVFERKASVKE